MDFTFKNLVFHTMLLHFGVLIISVLCYVITVLIFFFIGIMQVAEGKDTETAMVLRHASRGHVLSNTCFSQKSWLISKALLTFVCIFVFCSRSLDAFHSR